MTFPIDIQAEPELILTTSNESGQVLCYNDILDPIVYAFSGGTDDSNISINWTVGGNPVAAPQGIITTVTADSYTISGAASAALSADTVYSYEISANIAGCATLIAEETGSITLSASPSLDLQSSGTDNQTFCEGNSITDIEYQLQNGADRVQFQWTSSNVPNGLDGILSGGIFTISGTPSAQSATSEYTYQIIPINSSTGCTGTAYTGTITVNALSSLVAINPGANSQSICEGNPITPIEYSVGNAVSGINVTWTENGNPIVGNPLGIGYTWNNTNGQLVIGGNFSQNITTTTTYAYNVSTTGGLCGAGNVNGTLVVNPGPRIELSNSTLGSINQIKCEGEDIEDIIFNLVDGAENPTVLGLPAGVNYVYDEINNILTISGTLDSSNPNDNYNYTVAASGISGGCTTSIDGLLTISRDDVLTPVSDISQTVCEGENIELIRYDYSGGAVGVNLSWIVDGIPASNTPSGFIVGNTAGILTISGSPSGNFTSDTEFEYTVTTVNSGCTPATSYTGTITVIPKPVLFINSGPINQTVCEGVPINDVVIDSALGATNAIITWDFSPPGINSLYDPSTGQFTISGTPSGINEDTTYNYTVKAINSSSGCESNEFSGNITILNGHNLQLLSGSSSVNQTICEEKIYHFQFL